MDDSYNDEDIFELQHHHLLQCLEKATVRPTYASIVHIEKLFTFFRIVRLSQTTIISTEWRRPSELGHRRQWQVHRTRQPQLLDCCSRAAVDAARRDIRYQINSSKSRHKLKSHFCFFMIFKLFSFPHDSLIGLDLLACTHKNNFVTTKSIFLPYTLRFRFFSR